MKLKKTLSLLLALTLISTLVLPLGAKAEEYSMANFDPYTVSYRRGQFSDVSESAWYGMNNQGVVATACGLGLMNGTGSGFSPDGSLTIAQTVTMAARLYSIYLDDGYEFVQGSPWYQCYVDYAEQQHILDEGEFARDMNRTATRAEMAYIFYYALPDEELSAINSVTSLPDVDSSTEYCDHIFYLYNAGILTGNDAYGTFTPTSPITRSAAAAIISRMALPELRKRFTLQTPTAKPAKPSYPQWSYYDGYPVNSFAELEEVLRCALYNGVASFTVNYPRAFSNSDCSTLINDFWYLGLQGVSTSSYGSKLTINCDSAVAQTAALYYNPSTASQYCDASIVSYSSTIASLAASLNGGSDRQTLTNIHDYMVKNYKYDQSFGPDCREFYSLLNRKTGVCEAYSELFYLLCLYSGIRNYMVFGQATDNGHSEDHSWNYVCCDGQWSYVDVTWDDPTPDRGSSAQVLRDYFLVSSSTLSADHRWTLSPFITSVELAA